MFFCVLRFPVWLLGLCKLLIAVCTPDFTWNPPPCFYVEGGALSLVMYAGTPCADSHVT